MMCEETNGVPWSLWKMAQQANDYDFDNVRPGACRYCCHVHPINWPCVVEGLRRHVAFRLDKEKQITTERDAARRLLREIIAGDWTITVVQEFLGDLNETAEAGEV